MKKFVSLLLTFIVFLTAIRPSPASAEEYDNTRKITVTDFDIPSPQSGVYVYTNDGEKARVLDAKEYNFRSSTLMIFDGDGMLFEAGGSVYDGGPQQTVTVPAGGFMIACSGNGTLNTVYDLVMEGAMLYNSTMTVIYPVKGTLDVEGKSVTLEYDDPPKADEEAVKIMFVGNSNTYYNGTPIKLKALCAAAGISIDVTYCTEGSSYLSEFADESHDYGKKLRRLIDSGKFDYVILQDAGRASEKQTDGALEKLVPLIRENGAEPVMYLRYTDVGPSSWQAMLNSTREHYEVYTGLCEKYGMKLLPAGLSFLYCHQNYPDITLYADDNSHHSGYASYMIAAAWMYSLFGKTPVGNGFTAHYPEDTVKALWECAVKAVDEGYEFEPSASLTEREIDGTVYKNLAAEKKYTTTGERYSDDKWEDMRDDGLLNYKLTDGKAALTGEDTAIGAMKGKSTEVVIDLGEVKTIKQAETDLWGNSSWGIPDPSAATVSFLVSENGVDYTVLAKTDYADDGGESWKKGVFTATADKTVTARYIKIKYDIAGNFRWVSEICVFGLDKTDGEVSGESSDETEAVESSNDSPSLTESGESSHESADLQSGDGGTAWIWLIAAAALVIAVAAAVIIIKRKK